MKDRFEMGGEATVTAGPFGRLEALGRATADAAAAGEMSHDHQLDRLSEASSRRDGGSSRDALAGDLGGSVAPRCVRRRCDQATEARAHGDSQSSLNRE
jgi:hypothetical protein